MHALRLDRPVDAPSGSGASDALPRQIELLMAIRVTAMECRALGRAELFEACAMLSSNRATARMAYLETLVRCLPQAIGRIPRFHRPGAQELTFDEAWLMRLLDSVVHKDEASYEFLMRSRVERFARRSLAFLLHRIAEQATRREDLGAHC